MLLIFDLDGTLIDSRLDLAHSVNASRAEYGRGPLPHEVIFSYVGNGAPVLMKRAMGPDATEEEVAGALEFFLAYYREHALDNTDLYSGIRQGLIHLHDRGMKLAVLTNKPVNISKSIIRQLGLESLFFQVYGGNSFEHKKPHAIGIDTLRAETATEAAETWMIGDSYVDIKTARNAGVSACGVEWGFQPETFAQEPPDLLVGSLAEFTARILPR